MVLKGVNWVHNDKLGQMVLKGVNWVQIKRSNGLERSQLGVLTQWDKCGLERSQGQMVLKGVNWVWSYNGQMVLKGVK